MKLAAAALSLVLIVPGLAQSQTLAPPRLLYPGESPPSVPPPPPTPGDWPAADGSDVGLNSPGCGARTTYTGPTPISVNGTTITNKNFTGIIITGDNVTISCSSVRAGNSPYGIKVESTADNTLITKSRVYETNRDGCWNGKGIYMRGGATNLTVEDSEFYGGEDGMQIDSNGAVIRHNWFHNNVSGLKPGATDCAVSNVPGCCWNNHSDGISVQGGSNILITKNRLGPWDVTMNTSIMVQPTPSNTSTTNVDIIDNYIDGDGLVVATPGHQVLLNRSLNATCPPGSDLIGNTFGPGASPDARYLGVLTRPIPFYYGSSPNDCPPVASRSGSCSGNMDANGNPVGC